ncbi:MAG: hypothetical protein LC731_00275, partial [Acidobacteria bacterium]|nr:hypothetical protein [Acidobacteriota bacterium]
MSEAKMIRAPRGPRLNCKGWHQEAALRCLMNNLDPDVAEAPQDLVVYGGSGRAARNWNAFEAIVRELTSLENDETLLVQSGKPVAVFLGIDVDPARIERRVRTGYCDRMAQTLDEALDICEDAREQNRAVSV